MEIPRGDSGIQRNAKEIRAQEKLINHRQNPMGLHPEKGQNYKGAKLAMEVGPDLRRHEGSEKGKK